MKRHLSEPVALIALGGAIALLAALLGERAGTQGGPMFGGGLALMGVGAVWWLGKGHLREFQRKRSVEAADDEPS